MRKCFLYLHCFLFLHLPPKFAATARHNPVKYAETFTCGDRDGRKAGERFKRFQKPGADLSNRLGAVFLRIGTHWESVCSTLSPIFTTIKRYRVALHTSCLLRVTLALGFLHSRTNLSPFTKDFRGEGQLNECLGDFSQVLLRRD